MPARSQPSMSSTLASTMCWSVLAGLSSERRFRARSAMRALSVSDISVWCGSVRALLRPWNTDILPRSSPARNELAARSRRPGLDALCVVPVSVGDAPHAVLTAIDLGDAELVGDDLAAGSRRG